MPVCHTTRAAHASMKQQHTTVAAQNVPCCRDLLLSNILRQAELASVDPQDCSSRIFFCAVPPATLSMVCTQHGRANMAWCWFRWVACVASLLLVCAVRVQGQGPCPRAAPVSPLASPPPALWAQALEVFSSRMKDIMHASGAVGGVVTVVIDQQVVLSESFGTVAMPSSSASVNADTMFRIGSVSKVGVHLLTSASVPFAS